jgi:hypothetical protein
MRCAVSLTGAQEVGRVFQGKKNRTPDLLIGCEEICSEEEIVKRLTDYSACAG